MRRRGRRVTRPLKMRGPLAPRDWSALGCGVPSRRRRSGERRGGQGCGHARHPQTYRAPCPHATADQDLADARRSPPV